jgi:hypothetical protein
MTACGIPRHLAGKELKALRSRMYLPKRGANTAQGYIARAVDSLFDHGVELATKCHNRLLRRSMASYEPHSVGQEYFDVRDGSMASYEPHSVGQEYFNVRDESTWDT